MPSRIADHLAVMEGSVAVLAVPRIQRCLQIIGLRLQNPQAQVLGSRQRQRQLFRGSVVSGSDRRLRKVHSAFHRNCLQSQRIRVLSQLFEDGNRGGAVAQRQIGLRQIHLRQKSRLLVRRLRGDGQRAVRTAGEP